MYVVIVTQQKSLKSAGKCKPFKRMNVEKPLLKTFVGSPWQAYFGPFRVDLASRLYAEMLT